MTLRGDGRLGRFLISGAFNTLVTYLLYLLLLDLLGHRIAYAAAFAAGVALAYFLGRGFVFRTHAGWRTALLTPLIYLLQFGLGLAIVESWVTLLHLPAGLAPLAAVAVTIPAVYLLSAWAFTKR